MLKKERHLGAVGSIQEISFSKYGIWYFVFFLLWPAPKITIFNLFYGITTFLNENVPILTTVSYQYHTSFPINFIFTTVGFAVGMYFYLIKI